MRIPSSLCTLVEEGIIEEVVRPLMSGKEAQVYLVIAGGEQRVAKVYKEAHQRTFKHRAEYTEGRRVRNSRDQRARRKHSNYGRAQDEAAWRCAEVDMIYRLRNAGVRVPTPYNFVDGVLIMELVVDANGHPAPRLGDVVLDADEATHVFDRLLQEVVRMLCAGVVHGDLSDFNVLMAADGPVIIDLPQAVDTASNQSARKLLIRDVDNLHRFRRRCAPGTPARPYAQEMWDLSERGQLTPDTRLEGRVRRPRKPSHETNNRSDINEASQDERQRREALGLPVRGPALRGTKMEVVMHQPPSSRGPSKPDSRRPGKNGRGPNTGRRRSSNGTRGSAQPSPANPSNGRGSAQRSRDSGGAPRGASNSTVGPSQGRRTSPHGPTGSPNGARPNGSPTTTSSNRRSKHPSDAGQTASSRRTRNRGSAGPGRSPAPASTPSPTNDADRSDNPPAKRKRRRRRRRSPDKHSDVRGE